MAEKNGFLKSLVKPNPFAQVKRQFADYSSKVNWIVFISICVFTLGEFKKLTSMTYKFAFST